MTKNAAGFSVVILSAGEARRFGSAKQLADFSGKPLIFSVIQNVLSCGVEAHVALGANKELICQNESFQSLKTSIIDIQNWNLGLSETIKQCVCYFIEKQTSGIVFMLGDQPLIDQKYLAKFFSRVEMYPSSLLCTAYKANKDSYGIPAYFPKKYFDQLKKLQGDKGAKEILKKHEAYILDYDGGLFDIDEPDDLARAELMLKRKIKPV